ncbi:hypothetical protein OIU78_025462 [Salix suchowensis]|nr:hypothetical protein OIU78_025462 [Salix suchowensis]
MIDMHKELVENFFENANDMLQANGEIHVTHKTSPPFCHWNILELARRNYLGFIGRDDFKIEDYPVSPPPIPSKDLSSYRVLVTHLAELRTGATLLMKSQCLSVEGIWQDSKKFSCMKIHINSSNFRELTNLSAMGTHYHSIERLYADMVSTQREEGGLVNVYRETRAPLCT